MRRSAPRGRHECLRPFAPVPSFVGPVDNHAGTSLPNDHCRNSQFSGRVIGGQRVAIPSEPSNAARRPEPYPLPEGSSNITTVRNRPPQHRKEGDLITGAHNQSATGTLVERQTRMVRLLHLPFRDGDSLHTALIARMRDLPAVLLRSITWDQGSEMARHTTIARSLGAPVYFCDSRSPWQRGSNENANGLLGWSPKRRIT